MEIVLEAYEDDARQKYVLQAYSAWQIIETIKQALSEKAQPMPFADYLKKMNLRSSKEEKTDINKQAQAKAALFTAEKIKQLDAQQGRD